MAKRDYRWVRVKALTPEEKAAISAACDRLIADVLKPRYLPEIKPTAFNYPVDLFGKWRGRSCSFIVRYRSGWPENAGEEFNSAFARLDHDEDGIDEPRFHVMWHRYTGQWCCLFQSQPFLEALKKIETEPALGPPI